MNEDSAVTMEIRNTASSTIGARHGPLLRREERLDQIHLINVFVAVVDANGLAGAARKLQLSPPAVTRAVNELESHLGVRLLTRTTRVVRATEAGIQYAEDCRRILGDLIEANASASGTNALLQGQLTLTAPAWFGAKYVTPVVTEYLQAYPEVNAACWFMDRVVNMVEEGVDVAVRIANLPDSSMQAIRVGSMRVVICASPEYLERHGVPRTPDDLKKHSIASADAVAPGSDWRLKIDGQPRSIRLLPRLSTTNNEAAVAAAVSGFGLTQQMLYKVEDPLREGRLKTVLEDFEPAVVPVHLVHREGKHTSRRVRCFLDLAIDRLRAIPALR
ncbi:MAG: LysR family transcriptional regulator [Burkholderiales bacterium]